MLLEKLIESIVVQLYPRHPTSFPFEKLVVPCYTHSQCCSCPVRNGCFKFHPVTNGAPISASGPWCPIAVHLLFLNGCLIACKVRFPYNGDIIQESYIIHVCLMCIYLQNLHSELLALVWVPQDKSDDLPVLVFPLGLLATSVASSKVPPV